MEIEKYIRKMKEKQDVFKRLIDESEKEATYQELLELLENQRIRENQKEFKSFLYFLMKISKNHHRFPDFYSYINRILLHFKNQIQQFFPNWEVFKIFKGNKQILQFLIKEKILIIDQFVLNEIKKEKYKSFFLPELNEFDSIENIEDYEKRRQIGENESYICQLIRDDLIEDFVVYCNRTNLPISSAVIEPSIFETNSFLLNKKPHLIEYAAFYGSIQIYQYLRLNNVELTPELWLYAIHGKNGEIIHLLEENHVVPDDNTFQECYIEAIKCHHNDIAKYIKENLLQIDEKKNYDFTSDYFKYYNFEFIQVDQVKDELFNYLCRYDYDILVEALLRNGNININAIKI